MDMPASLRTACSCRSLPVSFSLGLSSRESLFHSSMEGKVMLPSRRSSLAWYLGNFGSITAYCFPLYRPAIILQFSRIQRYSDTFSFMPYSCLMSLYYTLFAGFFQAKNAAVVFFRSFPPPASADVKKKNRPMTGGSLQTNRLRLISFSGLRRGRRRERNRWKRCWSILPAPFSLPRFPKP